MKLFLRILFSLFFLIAMGTHVYYVFESDQKPLWWHGLYFISYGICWAMLFLKMKYKEWIYAVMSLFPFITHLYYGYRHTTHLDGIFWVCVLVCVLLPLGFILLRNEII